MNKKALVILVTMLISLAVMTSSSVITIAEERPNIDSRELKQKMDMDITDYKDVPKINKEQAIEIAKQAFPDLAAASKNIKAQINLMTYKEYGLFSEEEKNRNPHIKEKGYIDNSPMWIVSFKGLKIRRSGGTLVTDEMREKTAHEEENVVVDAETGEALFSFTYR